MFVHIEDKIQDVTQNQKKIFGKVKKFTFCA